MYTLNGYTCQGASCSISYLMGQTLLPLLPPPTSMTTGCTGVVSYGGVLSIFVIVLASVQTGLWAVITFSSLWWGQWHAGGHSVGCWQSTILHYVEYSLIALPSSFTFIFFWYGTLGFVLIHDWWSGIALSADSYCLIRRTVIVSSGGQLLSHSADSYCLIRLSCRQLGIFFRESGSYARLSSYSSPCAHDVVCYQVFLRSFRFSFTDMDRTSWFCIWTKSTTYITPEMDNSMYCRNIRFAHAFCRRSLSQVGNFFPVFKSFVFIM